MRRFLSFLLLILVVAAAVAVAHLRRDDLRPMIESAFRVDRETWTENPRMDVTATLTGADKGTLEAVSREISSFLSAVGDPARVHAEDSPIPRIVVKTTVLPNLSAMLEGMVSNLVARHPAALAARRKASPPRPAARRLAVPSRSTLPEQKKLEDIVRRRAQLLRDWSDEERLHARLDDLRRQYRHPEELLRRDEESRELKRKLSDLELTLAEIIDHYTLVHPRVKSLKDEISGVRSALDRRVMIAEAELKTDFSLKQAEFQRKKLRLDREERALRQTIASARVPADPAAIEAEPGPSAPIPGESVKLEWSTAASSKKELARTQEFDAGRLSTGLSVLLAAGALLGFLFGLMGSARSRGIPVEDLDLSHASPTPLAPPVPRPAKPRAPLPPLESPPAPAVPEKIIGEKELPGSAWQMMPELPKVEKNLYTVFAPTSASSEFFSAAARDLLDRLPKSDKTQVISIAALRSGAGASTFAANIAVALLARRPVLLIDLHHTAPGLHTCFSIEPTAHDLTSAAPWTESILKTPLDRLSLLPLFTPHTEKEMSDLKLKKRLSAFLKDNPVHRLVLVDLAPLGRSELFEEVAEYTDAFVLLCGPEPTGISAASALKRLTKTMKKRPILRVTRTREALPAATAARPAADYEFLIE